MDIDSQNKLTYYWMANCSDHVKGCPFPTIKTTKGFGTDTCSCPKEHIERIIKSYEDKTLEEYDKSRK